MDLQFNYVPVGIVATTGKNQFKGEVVDVSIYCGKVVALVFIASITGGDAIAMSLKVGKNNMIRCSSAGIVGQALEKQETKPNIITRIPQIHKNAVCMLHKDLNDVRHDTEVFFYSYVGEPDKVEIVELIRHKYPVLSTKHAERLYELMEEDDRIAHVAGTLSILALNIGELHDVIGKVIAYGFGQSN